MHPSVFVEPGLAEDVQVEVLVILRDSYMCKSTYVHVPVSTLVGTLEMEGIPPSRSSK